jgi:hypothetical protein
MSRRQRGADIVASPDLRTFGYVAVINDVELQDQLHLCFTGAVFNRPTMPAESMGVTPHPQLRSSSGTIAVTN